MKTAPPTPYQELTARPHQSLSLLETCGLLQVGQYSRPNSSLSSLVESECSRLERESSLEVCTGLLRVARSLRQ